MGWGERLGICELENAPEMQKCTKTFVHDCRFNVLKIDIVRKGVIVMWLFLIQIQSRQTANYSSC